MRALVLNGGGSFGSFQAGVIQGLAEQGRRWDLIVGTSVGALNGAFMAQAGRNDQAERAKALCELWGGIDRRSVYRHNWPGLVLDALPLPFPYKPGIFRTNPLRRLIEREIAPTPPPTRLLVTAVSLDDGTVRVTDAATTNIQPWVLASSAIPVVFPPVKIEGRYWIDGGVRRNNPIAEAVRAGATEIDTVLCFPTQRRRLTPLGKRWSLTDIAALTFLYAINEMLNGDAAEWNELPVRIYAPDTIPLMSPISFRRGEIERLIEHGKEVAARPGVGSDALNDRDPHGRRHRSVRRRG